MGKRRRSWVDLWLDNRAPTPKSGLLAADETWSAANGPYLVAAGFSVGAGATLTLEPGTTVYVEPGADFRVATGGTLNAVGKDPEAAAIFERATTRLSRTFEIVFGHGQALGLDPRGWLAPPD